MTGETAFSRRTLLAGGATLAAGLAAAQAYRHLRERRNSAPMILGNRRITFQLPPLRPKDRRVLWRSPTGASSYAAPAVAGGRLYVTGTDGIVRSLETKYGLVMAPWGWARNPRQLPSLPPAT